jgi:hypothetical protein
MYSDFHKKHTYLQFHDNFSFPPGLNELHCSLSIGGIPLLILATQETPCVGKSGGISPVKKKDAYIHMPLTLYPRRGSRGISDIPQRRLPKLLSYEKYYRQMVSPSPSDRSLSQVYVFLIP